MELTFSELDAERGEVLPAREALAVFNVADITAYNTAVAANVLTINSDAAAYAAQGIFVVQH